MVVPLSRSSSSRGLFVVFEGGDRSGKSTQAALLVKAFQERAWPVQALKFPDRTTAVGKVIDAYLQRKDHHDDEEIHLLFSQNRWEAAPTIRKLLAEGVSLIVDRYAYSGAAFTAAKGLDLTWCMRCDVGLPQPDLVVYLDVSPDTAAKRGGYGQERYETAGMQRAVRTQFLEHLLPRDTQTPWTVIDANHCSVSDVHDQLWRLVEQHWDALLRRRTSASCSSSSATTTTPASSPPLPILLHPLWSDLPPLDPVAELAKLRSQKKNATKQDEPDEQHS